jgi:hypothetical protein
MLESLLLGLFTHPELITEAEALFQSIAHGEGGAEKVATIGANLATVASTASAVAAGVKTAS